MSDIAVEVKKANFSEVLSEKYLSYALSTIMSRSLPDVRDGLKPVHRRILFAMRELKLNPQSGYKKCARVVGDVIGKFHPHGEMSVYDALVRLAQDFAARYTLVDGQGNFGNVDGDSAAAMRYTEARLTAVAEELLVGIDEDAVDFRVTYDNESDEPAVLPARFPNLLANGASGIAVGMATNIPPHNCAEICDALTYLIKYPDCEISKLTKHIKGPDFPTGGMLVDSPESILKAYETGRGSFRIRAKWEVEQLKNGTWQIIVTEIPYQVQKSRLIERIADQLYTKKITLLSDIRDESAEDIRLVLIPKSRNVDPAILMESLFKQTDLESRFSLNMNVLDAQNIPRVMNLKQVLQSFIAHRLEVLLRQTRYRLSKIEHRLEVLAGYIIAYDHLDEIIQIIREEDHPKKVLQKRFKFTDIQVDAILNLRLRSLRKLEEIQLREEHDLLTQQKKEFEDLLGSDELQKEFLENEFKDLRKRFGPRGVLPLAIGKRKTEISEPPEDVDIPIEAMIEKEAVTILCSKLGWIRIVKGHIDDFSSIKYKEGDKHQTAIHAYTTDKLLIFTSQGRFFTLLVNNLPGGRGYGDPLRLMIDMDQKDKIIEFKIYNPEGKLIVASTDARGFIVMEKDVIASTKGGKQVLNLGKGSKAKLCVQGEGDHVAIIGENRKILVFPVEQLPSMSKGRGLILQRYKDGGLSDVKVFSMEDGLKCAKTRKTYSAEELKPYIGTRAQAGRMAPFGFPRNNKFN